MTFDALAKNYTTLTVKQLKQLLNDVENEDQEIRVWVEMKNNDGDSYLEGRRLIGMTDDPNEDLVCLVATHYEVEEIEE